MRLTTNENGSYVDNNCIVPQSNDIITKLGQLEDIEDELGVDLEIFLKALENGFYRYRPTARNNVICFIAKPKVNMKQKCFTYGSYGKSYFKDCGKTWALTKEELE